MLPQMFSLKSVKKVPASLSQKKQWVLANLQMISSMFYDFVLVMLKLQPSSMYIIAETTENSLWRTSLILYNSERLNDSTGVLILHITSHNAQQNNYWIYFTKKCRTQCSHQKPDYHSVDLVEGAAYLVILRAELDLWVKSELSPW